MKDFSETLHQDLDDEKLQSMGVSFGRRVIPYNDRVAERQLIIEKRKHLDSLISKGLAASGIQLDDVEKRMHDMHN